MSIENIENARASKTPEERSAIAKKAHESRRRNKERLESAAFMHRVAALAYAGNLKAQIETLEIKLNNLKNAELVNEVFGSLTDKTLLHEQQIVEQSVPMGVLSGVYFLIREGKVIYVGQSVNVFARMAQHEIKNFERYAYVPCDKKDLNVLESLYIHCLQPESNGMAWDKGKSAPFRLSDLLEMAREKSK